MADRPTRVTNQLDMNEVFETEEEASHVTGNSPSPSNSVRNGNISSKGKLTGYFHGLKV
jgi:hypothetical protein